MLNFKKYIPDKEKLLKNKSLKIFGKMLHAPYLWHLSRTSVANAVAIGLFVTWIPFPGHTILAALLAFLFRANLPTAIAGAWVINPITIAPLYIFAYKLGAYILGAPATGFASFSFSLQWLMEAFDGRYMSLALGCFICGSISAIIGYFAVKLIWRYVIVKNWKSRHL